MLRDAKNRLTSRVTFCDAQSAAGLKARWGGKPGANEVRAEVFKTVEGEELPLLEGRGNWARYFQFEDRLYWRVSDRAEMFVEEPAERCLPSSAYERRELRLIQQKRYAEADRLMEALELAEHKDEQLRRGKK